MIYIDKSEDEGGEGARDVLRGGDSEYDTATNGCIDVVCAYVRSPQTIRSLQTTVLFSLPGLRDVFFLEARKEKVSRKSRKGKNRKGSRRRR